MLMDLRIGECPQLVADLVADTAECGEDLVIGAFRIGWVVKAPVDSRCAARENRAAGVRIIADSDNEIEGLGKKFVQAFRTMAGNIDADLGHNRDGLWPHKTRDRSRAFRVKLVTGDALQQPLGHLAAGRVSGA